ncbi:MAG: hypothetical protein OXF23_01175 [Candidatus Dadabacteria bacterium]|nr:hypothetical protein [Candidatus Dadabacteria bacterium]
MDFWVRGWICFILIHRLAGRIAKKVSKHLKKKIPRPVLRNPLENNNFFKQQKAKSFLSTEMTDTPNSVKELALSNVAGTKVEKSYIRSELIDRRRTLMQAWIRGLGAYGIPLLRKWQSACEARWTSI